MDQSENRQGTGPQGGEGLLSDSRIIWDPAGRLTQAEQGRGAISAWGTCPHGWPPAVHQSQAGFSCQNPLSKYREAAQPVGGFPGTQTGKPVCVIRGVG